MRTKKTQIESSVKKFGKTEKRRAVRVLDLIEKAVTTKTALANISSQDPSSPSSPFRVLISTMLSARTKDPVTEKASARLFSHFPDADSLSMADKNTVSSLIKPVLYYNVKAQRIIEVSKILVEKYGGRVPDNFDELLALPGVGRKTANCVLVYAFKLPAIPVDVHVHRISNRIGLVKTKTPETTEEELAMLYDKKYWVKVNELFVAFGQTICKPIVPRCKICDVRPLCNYYQSEVKTGKRPSSS